MDKLEDYVDHSGVRHQWFWEDGKMHFKQSEDVSRVLDWNRELASKREVRAFSGDSKMLHHHMKVPSGVWMSLKSKGYDLMSDDADVRKAAIKYLEQNYPWLISSGRKLFR